VTLYGTPSTQAFEWEPPGAPEWSRRGKSGFTRFVAEFLRDLRTPLYRNAIFLMANTVVANGLDRAH